MKALAVILAAVAMPAVAQEPSTGQTQAPQSAGVWVELEPSAAKTAATAGRRDYSVMRLERRPDGTLMLHTNGAVNTAVMGRVAADGTLHLGCEPNATHSHGEEGHHE